MKHTKLGARGLKSVLEKGLLEIQYDLPEYRDGWVSEITVTEKTLKGEKPMLTYEFDAKDIKAKETKKGKKEDNGTTGKEWNKDCNAG